MTQPPATFSLVGFMQMARYPNLLIIVLTQYLTAIFLVGPSAHWKAFVLDPPLFILIASTVVLATAGYLINDYYDVKIDYVNKPDRVVVGRLVKRRSVMVAHTILNFTGIGLGLLVGFRFMLINLFAAFLLWLYSNQLKRMPLVGNVAVSLLTGISIWVVSVYYNRNMELVLIYAVFAFFINLIRELVKDMEDIRGDARFGAKTLPVVWGFRKTKIVVFTIIGLFITTLFILQQPLNNPVLTTYFLVMALPFIHFAYQLYRADRKRHFSWLSLYLKLIMLSGVLSMVFF